MAEGKNSFIFYTDWYETFKQLPKDKGYDLLIHILSYVSDENPKSDDPVINAVFPLIKNTLKRDLKEWDDVRQERSDSGRLGNLKRWHRKIYERIIKKEITLDEAEVIASDRKSSLRDNSDRTVSQTVANIAVSGSVSVNVSVTEIGADKSTQPFYDMLVPEIVQVWMQENPGYHFSENLDYSAALKIAYQIAGVKKWKKTEVLEEKKNECVESWKKISKFIMANSWFSKMTLDTISSDKMWQKIVVEMQSKSNGNGKMEDPDYMQTARQEYIKNRK